MSDLEMARQLWEEFGDVPIDDDDCITCEWRTFSKGTSRFGIWKWFEVFFDVSVAKDLMYPDSDDMPANNEKIKIHARVTREVELLRSEVELLTGLARGSLNEQEEIDAKKVLAKFTQGIYSGSYESGYIPSDWLQADTGMISNYFSNVEL